MYRYFSGFVASLMCLISASPALSAQTPTQAKLTIEDLGPDSTACGITKQKIRSVILATMRYNRITETDSTSIAVPIIYINVVTLMSGGACKSHIGVVLRAWASATVDYESQGPIYGFLELGRGPGHLISSPANSFEHWGMVETSLRSNFEEALSYAAENHKMSKVLW